MANMTFEAIKIGLASPELIREWSYGEVKKPDAEARAGRPVLRADFWASERLGVPLRQI